MRSGFFQQEQRSKLKEAIPEAEELRKRAMSMNEKRKLGFGASIAIKTQNLVLVIKWIIMRYLVLIM